MSEMLLIDKNECLGDVLEKINSNLVKLETLTCNLYTSAQKFEYNRTLLQNTLLQNCTNTGPDINLLFIHNLIISPLMLLMYLNL